MDFPELFLVFMYIDEGMREGEKERRKEGTFRIKNQGEKEEGERLHLEEP